MDAKEGADKMSALGKHMKAIEPALKKLQRRLEQARKLTPPKPKPEASSKKARKRAKETPKDEETDDDFLSKLDSL